MAGGLLVKKRTSYNDYMSYYTATSEALALDERAPREGVRQRRDQPLRKQSRHPHEEGRPPRKYDRHRRTDKKGRNQHEQGRVQRKEDSPLQRAKRTVAERRANRLKAPKKRKEVVYIKDEKTNNTKFFSVRLLITLAMIFIGMIAIASSSAILRKSQADISSMRRELVMLQDEEAVLRAKLSEDYDMTQIEKIATIRLNMRKPRADQIVYINLPRHDYVIHHGIAQYDDEPDGLFDVIGRMLNSAKATLTPLITGER
jgi:cell division protein FtsB